jgi:hypothetical protein
VLTNGITWELYRMRFERPIDCDLVLSFNFLELNPRKTEDQQKLFVLSKRGIGKSVRDDYYERVKSVNRFVIGAIVVSESIMNAIRRDIRRLAPGVKVDNKEIEQILHNEVLKRDVIEGDEASKAMIRVRKIAKKAVKRAARPRTKKPETPAVPSMSLSNRLTSEFKHEA